MECFQIVVVLVVPDIIVREATGKGTLTQSCQKDVLKPRLGVHGRSLDDSGGHTRYFALAISSIPAALAATRKNAATAASPGTVLLLHALIL